MTWEEYKIEALKTWNKDDFTEEQAFDYIVMKLIEEFGELVGSLAKEKYHKKPNNNLEELGDIYWYLAVWESMVGKENNIKVAPYSTIIDEICFSLIDLINALSFEWRLSDRFLAKMSIRANRIANALNLSLSDVWNANIAKLRKRHGESYNAKHYTGE